MVQVYYRTEEAVAAQPLALEPNPDGLLKEDYEFVREYDTDDAPSLDHVSRQLSASIAPRPMMPGDVVVDEDGDVWYRTATDWEETTWW